MKQKIEESSMDRRVNAFKKAVTLIDKNKPYFNETGDLVIPFNSPLKYHWWAGGNSLKEILEELKPPSQIIKKYLSSGTDKK